MFEFGCPKYGWLNISIEDNNNEIHYFSASYLTDVPLDLLKAAIIMLKDKYPFCLEIDTESKGYYSFFNSDYMQEFLILDHGTAIECPYIEPIKLANKIMSFTEENLEAIYTWLYSGKEEDDEEEYNQYKKDINESLKTLKELIKKESL